MITIVIKSKLPRTEVTHYKIRPEIFGIPSLLLPDICSGMAGMVLNLPYGFEGQVLAHLLLN